MLKPKKRLNRTKKREQLPKIIGEHPGTRAAAGKKTPQEHVDKDAIDESGNLLYDDGKGRKRREIISPIFKQKKRARFLQNRHAFSFINLLNQR
ncbi:MAG: hypothetical protein WKF83_06945 [Nocardioidaceae bacterium]